MELSFAFQISWCCKLRGPRFAWSRLPSGSLIFFCCCCCIISFIYNYIHFSQECDVISLLMFFPKTSTCPDIPSIYMLVSEWVHGKEVIWSKDQFFVLGYGSRMLLVVFGYRCRFFIFFMGLVTVVLGSCLRKRTKTGVMEKWFFLGHIPTPEKSDIFFRVPINAD